MPARTIASRLVLVIFCLSCLVMAEGCGQKAEVATAPAPQAKPAAAPKVYAMRGVIRSVESDEGIVTIRHENIPGLMPAMTMPFTVSDKAMLDNVEAGDEVEATLTMTKGSSLLTELTVTRPAPPPSVTLNTKGGVAKLESRPKALEVGELVPDFTITTQDDQPLKLSELRGQVVVLTFIYTRCPLPEFCPMLDKKFRALAEIEERSPERAKAVRLLSISFDPEYDTPAILSDHARIQGAKPPLWTFAVASHEELTKVASALGLMYGPTPNEIIHNRVVAVIGPDGKLARLITGSEGATWTAIDVSKIVHRLILTVPK